MMNGGCTYKLYWGKNDLKKQYEKKLDKVRAFIHKVRDLGQGNITHSILPHILRMSPIPMGLSTHCNKALKGSL
jgi:hypothetical protein